MLALPIVPKALPFPFMSPSSLKIFAAALQNWGNNMPGQDVIFLAVEH